MDYIHKKIMLLKQQIKSIRQNKYNLTFADDLKIEKLKDEIFSLQLDRKMATMTKDI